MHDPAALAQRIARIFEENLRVAVPSADTDLFETGALDSLAFVDLLLEIEREYGLKVPLERLELESFRSIGRIAAYLAQALDGRALDGSAPAAAAAQRRHAHAD
jgi:acyl carrier protein